MFTAILATATCLFLAVQDPATQPATTTPDAETNMDNKEVTHDDGLIVKDLGPIEPMTVQKGDIVSVLYKGTLTDGTVFDASTKHLDEAGAPSLLTFKVGAGQMIGGFDRGVEGMKEGTKRQLTLPPELAYGNRAVGAIPANSTLMFEVTLVRVYRPE